ncbi:hypothetical protein [Myxococcus sp. NMCA1]|uniref:hypothetical protein n=1 Tax=Myxococcus sp. NMCA1 TaxID=2996785 RepID=UPI00228635BE|nr:hypothetical protein [Myxococcus sp. NMCA1]WAM23784.1 hypothetical protein OZ403_24915 [Myxococcus sp. NMCA1]
MSAPLGGSYRYTREGRGVFHFPLARPWTWALTHHGMWSVFVADVEPARQGVPARRHPLHPPAELMGCWLAIYATREYDAEAVRWLRAAHGLEVPAGDVLPADSYVAVARLAEVSTVGNDYRAFGRDPWWAPRNAPFCRGTIAWWLEEIQYVEPLPSAPAKRLAPVDPGLVPELRERMRLARDKLWRPEVYAVPASLPIPPPARVEEPVPAPPPQPPILPAPPPRAIIDDRPVPPMLAEPEQLGLFGEAPRREESTTSTPLMQEAPPAEAVSEAATHQDVLDTLHQLQPHCRTPPAVLMEGARRVRALLSDGKPHEWRELWAAATIDPARGSLAYRVTETLAVHGPLLPWRVRTTGTCKSDGYAWFTLAEDVSCSATP